MWPSRWLTPTIGVPCTQASALADEHGPLGHRDAVEIAQPHPRLRERPANDGHDHLEVAARGELGHDAAVGGVDIVLGGDDAREHLAPAVEHGGGGLVARRLDAEHDHVRIPWAVTVYRASWDTGTRRMPRASQRGTYSRSSRAVSGCPCAMTMTSPRRSAHQATSSHCTRSPASPPLWSTTICRRPARSPSALASSYARERLLASPSTRKRRRPASTSSTVRMRARSSVMREPM